MGRFQVISFFSSFSDAHPVRELGLQLSDLKVDLVQVLVHKSHQALLHHLEVSKMRDNPPIEEVNLRISWKFSRVSKMVTMMFTCSLSGAWSKRVSKASLSQRIPTSS